MQRDATSDILRKLDTLLNQERAVLVEGKLEELAGLLTRKTSLIEALGKNAVEGTIIPASLKQKAERNQALLEAAQEGLKQVSKRLATIRNLHGRLQTYDADGRTLTIEGDVVHRVEKHA